MRWLLTALAFGAVACGSPSAPPVTAPSPPAATTPVPVPPSPAPSESGPGGVSREEAEQRDVRHAGYAVGVAGPLRVVTEAGSPTRVVYTVTNTGDRDDTYVVSATRAPGGELVVRPERVAVEAGAQARVEVLVPHSAGRSDVRVVVRSTSDAGVRDEATTTVLPR